MGEGDFLNQYIVAGSLNQSLYSLYISQSLCLHSLTYSVAVLQYLPSYSQHTQGKFVLCFNLFSECLRGVTVWPSLILSPEFMEATILQLQLFPIKK